MKQKDRVIVSAILLTTDNKILLGRMRKGGVYDDCWHIPGGGVEQNETHLDALKRELLEEVGIDISQENCELVYDNDSDKAVKVDKDTGEEFLVTMHFNVYLVKLEEDSNEVNVVLSDDITGFTWADVADLKNYKLPSPSMRLFKKIGRL